MPAALALLLPALLACGGKKSDAAADAADATPDAAADTTPDAATDTTPDGATDTTPDGATDATQADTTQADTTPPSPEPMTSSEGYAVYRALSIRDPAPECADVEAMTTTPVDTLLEVVDRAQLPPWAPMRAAACLVSGHGAEIADTLGAWVTGDDTRGLALLVLDSIDALPEDVALSVAEQALGGPWAEDASGRIAKSTRPALVALVEGAQQ